MSKKTLAGFMICAALAACSNSDTNRAVTGPDAGPALNEVPSSILGGSMYDGPSDLVLGSAAASMQMAAASPNAASGSRASGHVALTLGTGFFTNIATEEYNFVALSTDPLTPFAAKGEYHMTLVTTTGVVQEFRGKVICVATVGNTARMAGQLTSVVVNGIPRTINPNQSHNIWSVTDNGEGQATPDTASPMIFFNATFAPLHCANDFIPPQFSSNNGNIQVR